jgi:high affinity Mn2+ porin
MRSHRWLNFLHLVVAFASTAAVRSAGAEPTSAVGGDPGQNWNWHVQNTDIVQADPAFSAAYSGPNSLNPKGEVKETLSFDLYAGARLWRGAEAHVDGLVWQGFGLSNTEGVEGFPNGEAFRLGRQPPGVIVARLFLRQTFDLGGEQEKVEDDALNLGGNCQVSRLTLTLGKISAKDIFDNNAYANDPRTQFMSWALMANEAWDYPADSLGFETGFAAELNQSDWALRYGFFQVPRYSNAMPTDMHLLKAWGMVVEFERRYELGKHPGTARLLVYDNRAHMGSYQAALDAPGRPADIVATRAYRSKRGIGFNIEQEIAKNVGVFSRLGWSDVENEAWVFADVDYAASAGVSFAGERWHRAGDTFAIAGVVSGISRVHQRFFTAGGTGILGGDGMLSYGTERLVEAYYDVLLGKGLHATLDYQFVVNPAYNRDRGPVSVFALRTHVEF